MTKTGFDLRDLPLAEQAAGRRPAGRFAADRWAAACLLALLLAAVAFYGLRPTKALFAG